MENNFIIGKSVLLRICLTMRKYVSNFCEISQIMGNNIELIYVDIFWFTLLLENSNLTSKYVFLRQ